MSLLQVDRNFIQPITSRLHMLILPQHRLFTTPQPLTPSLLRAFLALFKNQENCLRSVQSGFRYDITSTANTSQSTTYFCNKPRLTTNLSKKITNRQSLGVSL